MFEAMAAERKRQRDEDREERRRVRVEDRDEREEREAETSRRMAASQESRAHALYVSESAEKVRSWELYRADLVGTPLLPRPSLDLVSFIRNFYSYHLTDDELVRRFAITISLYPLLHAHVILTGTLVVPPGTPIHLLSDAHIYLGSMGAIFYFNENKETARDGGKKIGGLARALVCPSTHLREDLSVIRKQEGTDAVTRLYKAELASLAIKGKEKVEKVTSFSSAPTTHSSLPTQEKPYCHTCFTNLGKKYNNHTTAQCRRSV